MLLRFFEPPGRSLRSRRPTPGERSPNPTDRAVNESVQLRLAEPRGPQPLDAEGRNTPLALRLHSPLAAAENELGRLVMNWVVFVRPLGRAGRTPAHGRPATRRLRVESCRSSRASGPLSSKSRRSTNG